MSMTSTSPAVPVARNHKSGSPARQGQAWRPIVGTLVNSLAVAFGVVVITYFLIRALLGDPAYRYAMTQNAGMPPAPESVEAARAHLGLDGPLLVQFFDYITGLFRGDLGTSFQGAEKPVSQLVFSGFSITLVLTALAIVVAGVVGTALGLALAPVRSPIVDNIVRIIAMAGLAAPSALVGLVLIWAASVSGGPLPAGGWGFGYPDNFRFLILPVLTLSVWFVPAIMRMVLERARAILTKGYVSAARSRGISPVRLLLVHVLPECLVPLLRFIALNTAGLLSGAVVIETIFGIPGIGRTLMTAVTANDFPVIQACAMLTGLVVVVCFAIAQIIGGRIDPRIRS